MFGSRPRYKSFTKLHEGYNLRCWELVGRFYTSQTIPKIKKKKRAATLLLGGT